jgi:hypothetical protein
MSLPLRAVLLVIVLAATAARADDDPPLAAPAALVDFTWYYAGAAPADIPSVATSPASDGIAEAACDCSVCPLWTVQAGAVILARTSRSTSLIETITGAPLLNTRDLGTPWAAGPDIAVQRWLSSGSSLQFRFFDVDGWNSRASIATPPLLTIPTFPPLFGLGINTVTATYATRLYSTELNLLRPTSDWFSWLIGFRWVELYENLNEDFDFGLGTANLRWQTANRLYGGQAGASVSLWNRGAMRIDSVFKAGLYGNAASNQFRISQAVGPSFGFGDHQGQVAFLGEIGVVGVYQWTDNIAFRGGYQLLWLDGVALAPDQVAATRLLTGDGIDPRGDSFYHGALLGIEVGW